MALQDVLGEFGSLMGIDGFGLGEQGVAALQIEGMGLFCIEPRERDIVAYLVRELPAYAGEAPRKALELCDWRRGHPFPVTAGMKGETTLAFLMQIPEREVSLQTLENGLQYLARLHDEAAE